MANATPRCTPYTPSDIAQQTQQYLVSQQYQPFYPSYEQHPQYQVHALSTPYQDYRRNQQQQREQHRRSNPRQLFTTTEPTTDQRPQRGLIAFARNARGSDSEYSNEYEPYPVTYSQPLPLHLQPSPLPDWMLHPNNWIHQATTALTEYLSSWRGDAFQSVYVAGTEHSPYDHTEIVGEARGSATCNSVHSYVSQLNCARRAQREWKDVERRVLLLGQRHAHLRLELARHRQRAKLMSLEAAARSTCQGGTEKRAEEVLRMWGVKHVRAVGQRAERWEKRSMVLAAVEELEEEEA